MNKLLLTLKLLVSPHSTWARLLGGSTSSSESERKLFYPLVFIVALSAVGLLWQEVNLTIGDVVIAAFVQAISFILSLYICVMAISWGLNFAIEKDAFVAPGKVKTFVLYCLAILMLISIVKNLLPAVSVFFDLFPIYLIIPVWQATEFLHIDKEKNAFFVVGATALLIVTPWLVSPLFSFFV